MVNCYFYHSKILAGLFLLISLFALSGCSADMDASFDYGNILGSSIDTFNIKRSDGYVHWNTWKGIMPSGKIQKGNLCAFYVVAEVIDFYGAYAETGDQLAKEYSLFLADNHVGSYEKNYNDFYSRGIYDYEFRNLLCYCRDCRYLTSSDYFPAYGLGILETSWHSNIAVVSLEKGWMDHMTMVIAYDADSINHVVLYDTRFGQNGETFHAENNQFSQLH